MIRDDDDGHLQPSKEEDDLEQEERIIIPEPQSPPLHNNNNNNSNNVFRIKIKSVSLSDSFDMVVRENDTILNLIQKIRETKQLGMKSIRLIFRGKILKEHETIRNYGMQDMDNVHCAISDLQRPIRNEGPPDVEDAPLRGLDRLREMGFNEDEIEQFRLLFYQAHRQRILSAVEAGEVDLRQLEEEWISSSEISREGLEEAQQQEQEYRDTIGTYNDLFWGMVMGFSLGFIMLFWIFDTSLPRRTKYGILAGVGCNISFGLIRLTRYP